MLQRRRDIATMRALGARRRTIVGIVLLESCTITSIGGILGIVASCAIARLGAQIIAARGGLAFNPPLFTPLQPVVLVGVVVLGMLAGIIPAIMAYRREVAEHLSPLS
jgi:putative ABC transport system permease protein